MIIRGFSLTFHCEVKIKPSCSLTQNHVFQTHKWTSADNPKISKNNKIYIQV